MAMKFLSYTLLSLFLAIFFSLLFSCFTKHLLIVTVHRLSWVYYICIRLILNLNSPPPYPNNCSTLLSQRFLWLCMSVWNQHAYYSELCFGALASYVARRYARDIDDVLNNRLLLATSEGKWRFSLAKTCFQGFIFCCLAILPQDQWTCPNEKNDREWQLSR